MQKLKRGMRIVAVILALCIVFFIALVENWITPMRPRRPIHFSIDDVIQVFIDLTSHSEDYTSIFDNEMLGEFRRLHERYGACFSLYCYYEIKDFDLTMVPARYHDEFERNGDWLQFGYHARNGNEELENISAEDMANEYSMTVNELERITGSITNTLRLSYFHGNRDAMLELNKVGVTTLLTADDDRISYYLDSEESKYIAEHDAYSDDIMRFVSTDFRLDYLRCYEVLPSFLYTAMDHNQQNIMVVFTHEWLMNKTMYGLIEQICFLAERYHYFFVTQL